MSLDTIPTLTHAPTAARALERRGISGHKQHRNRNTWTRDALEGGVPETAIVVSTV